MNKFSQYTLLLIAGLWLLLFPMCVKAQNTFSYSTISYDAANNIVTSYAQTSPDYSTQVYYGTMFVSSSIKDASGNQLASQTSSTGILSMSVSGNGSSSYTVSSGHWIIASYSMYNTYSPCNQSYYY